MPGSRRAQVLAATLIVAIVGAMAVRSMDDGGTTPARAGRGAGAAAPAGNQPAGVDDTATAMVNLQVLRANRTEPTPSGRDPFRFRQKAPPPVPPSPIRPSEDPSAGAAMPMVPTGPPPPPPIPLKFIGVVEKADGTRIAVLSDGRGPVHGVEGQEIAGQYKIVRIGEESIEIAYIDGRGRQTIRLTGQ